MTATSEDSAMCIRCDGCGQIDNGDTGEPWSAWEALPEQSKLFMRLGIVKPIPCPDCSS